jgi:tetratricopeptide (TPR) repeat protein
METRHYLVAIALLVTVSIALQVRRDNGWQAYDPPTPVMWLQAGPAMERATLGYQALVADIYWIRAVVYYGRQRLSEGRGNYDLLYPLLDLATSLDQRFLAAYRFGAFFLSEREPGGPDRPDLAIRLLERGLERNPTRWEFPHDIGFVYYFSYRDYPRAAEWFERGSTLPAAPIWLRTMAATTLAVGGDRENARVLWRHLYEDAESDALKENALIRLAQLDAFDAIDQLNPIVRRHKEKTGRFPATWAELITARVLRDIPRDPTGTPYFLDSVNEDVRISSTSKLLPLAKGNEAYAP